MRYWYGKIEAKNYSNPQSVIADFKGADYVGNERIVSLEVWSLLVHEYEQKHYKIQPLTAIEALKYEMEEQGLTQTALAQRFGISKSTISEILSGKKQMSVNFLKFLHKDLGIPANALLG